MARIGFALHLRVGVVEHRRQLGQRFAAAEHAQQIDGRAAHRRIGRVLQLLDRLAAGRAEAEQQLAQPPRWRRRSPRPRAVRRAAGPTPAPIVWQSRLRRLDLDVVDLAQVRADVAHERPRREPFDDRVARPRAVAAGRPACVSRTSASSERLRASGHRRAASGARFRPTTIVGHALPARRVVLDAQQIEQQVEIEIAAARSRDRREPAADAFRRIVGHALHFDRLRRARPTARGRIRRTRISCPSTDVSMSAALCHSSSKPCVLAELRACCASSCASSSSRSLRSASGTSASKACASRSVARCLGGHGAATNDAIGLVAHALHDGVGHGGVGGRRRLPGEPSTPSIISGVSRRTSRPLSAAPDPAVAGLRFCAASSAVRSRLQQRGRAHARRWRRLPTRDVCRCSSSSPKRVGIAERTRRARRSARSSSRAGVALQAAAR